MNSIKNTGVRIQYLDDYADERGSSFGVSDAVFDYLGSVTNMHFADLETGGIRGNHYHNGTKEAILVRYEDQWTLGIALPDGTQKEECVFKGAGCVVVAIEPNIVHAVCNTGVKRLSLVALYEARLDGQETQTVRVGIF